MKSQRFRVPSELYRLNKVCVLRGMLGNLKKPMKCVSLVAGVVLHVPRKVGPVLPHVITPADPARVASKPAKVMSVMTAGATPSTALLACDASAVLASAPVHQPLGA